MFQSRHLAVAAALSLLAGQAIPAPTAIQVRPGGGLAEWQSDDARCNKAADSARLDDLPVGNPVPVGPVTGGLTTVAGAEIGFVIVGLIETSHQRRLAASPCMRNLGYGLVRLEPVEDRAYRRLETPEAENLWRQAFLSQDLTTRLNVALTPAVPRLPPYRDQPFTQGGLQVDPDSLASAPGPVQVNGVVLTGKATRSRTAVLAEPFQTDAGYIQVAGSPGTVFYQADMRPQREPLLRQDGATWCGPVTQTAARGPSSIETYCFAGRDDGYEIYQTNGYDWFGGAYGDGFTLPRFTKPIVLRERDHDDLGPLDFEIRAAAIRYNNIDLKAVLRRGGTEVIVWSRRLKFNAEGVATLPLWRLRLALTRFGTISVKAIVDDHGDGHGWRDGD